ncbi:hypothetical protein EYC80_010574 [Monilinia laxa]|uniref:Uncharacterized protein n=1 Tax=Monilinia laxa TaxID=61186 RepID=A0A5N6JMR4_MONLA|nr:hypothetical protein EYC80_010574 [Monilinia laxa]
MAPSKQPRYDSSPSPRARTSYGANKNNTGANSQTWGSRAKTTSGRDWMKRILDDENDGEDASVDIEGVTRDIGKLREEEANGTGRGWDTDLDFTARSMDLNQSPRLKTTGIPSRIEEIMADERSFGEDDDEDEDEGEEDAGAYSNKVQDKPARRENIVDKAENQKASQAAENGNAIKDTARAKSQERRERLRRELRERREERRPVTSYESEDNKIPQERQEGVLRNRLSRERRSKSGDFSKNDLLHVDLPVRSMRNEKENIMPQGEKPLSRLERRYQEKDVLKSIQRARENRTRNNYNNIVPETTDSQPKAEYSQRATETTGPRSRVEHSQRASETAEPRSRTDYSYRASENIEPRSLERVEGDGIEDMHEKTILEEEGERIHGTPITVFSGNERRPNGPNSKQQDSLQILRNLSKTITDTSGNETNDPEARKSSERTPFELEHVSEKFQDSAPTPPPSAPIDPQLLPTPRVTGAWIETPAPPRMRTNGRTPREPQIKEEPSSPRSHSEPSKPSQSHSRTRPTPINSAPTVSAAADLERIEKEARVDDSTTIDRDFSLIIKNQSATPPASENIKINLDFDEKGQPLSQKEKEKRLEELAFHRMSRSLKHTSSSIRDARHGIESPFFLDAPPNPALNPNVHYLMIPFPRLRYPGTGRLTWFGLIFTIFIAWFVTEWAMCETYCHPKYSTKDVWRPSDPYWPWAIPTKIDQWTGKVVSGKMEDVWDWWQGWDEEIRIWEEKSRREFQATAHKIAEVGGDEVVDGKKRGSWWSWDNDEVL